MSVSDAFYEAMIEKKDKEIEFWRERAKKLADDKIRLRDLLNEEIKKDIKAVLKRNKWNDIQNDGQASIGL